MKIETLEIAGLKPAIHGMRNPLESWNKSDSDYCVDMDCEDCMFGDMEKNLCKCDKGLDYILGKVDKGLAQRLIIGGTEHRKFLRQIQVWADITAPLYWWKEFDTYKVGTTANSTSTMHKLMSKPITRESFEMDDFGKMVTDIISPDKDYEPNDIMTMPTNEFTLRLSFIQDDIIAYCESLRQNYIRIKEKGLDKEAANLWRMLIQILPESWLQTRTVSMNYENLRNMYFQRRNHKLSEWGAEFCGWIESLPYAEELIIFEENKDE